MPEQPIKKTVIAVVGDVIVDNHIYEGQRPAPTMQQKDGVRLVREEGGAVMLARLIKAAAGGDAKPEDQPTPAADAAAEATVPGTPQDPAEVRVIEPVVGLRRTVRFPPVPLKESEVFRAYATWRPHGDAGKANQPVWRAALLGYGGDKEEPLTFQMARPNNEATSGQPIDLLVIDDAGTNFRNEAFRKSWGLQDFAASSMILLKLSAPVGRGGLWLDLAEKYRDRLVCVTSIDDLRLEHGMIRQGVSWERVVEDLRDAIFHDAVLRQLSQCRHLVITIGCDGALWINNEIEGKPAATLVFDAEHAEGDWSAGRSGKVTGLLASFSASLAVALCEAIESGDTTAIQLTTAIGRGLRAMRNLEEFGHGPAGVKPTGFPIERIAAAIRSDEATGMASKTVPWSEDSGSSKHWMILESSQIAPGFESSAAILGVARRLVIAGPGRILRDVPHARFGKMTVVDRQEIEALRGIKDLMEVFKSAAPTSRPLSIGVFGPPGAGKSFGVRQLSDELFGERAWLEFNLSQFGNARDLMGPFHQARDLVLSGVTPVVFWDEFDSREYDWLQYLLAPMQDGRFQDGQLNHGVGKVVFVFAGGTSPTFKAFGPEKKDAGPWKEFQLRKGPDFLSRLDAYYDVVGPNPRQLHGVKGSDGEGVPDPKDVSFPVRRALLVRANLAGPGDEHIDIDSDLLNALLMVPEYLHGSRSLEKMVKPLGRNEPAHPIRRSALPSDETLAMHVDLEAFNAILKRNETFRTAGATETLARAIQAQYLATAEPHTVADHLNHPHDDLAPADQEDNRVAARRMPDILALIGLGVAPARDPGVDVHADGAVEAPIALPPGSDAPADEEVDALIELHLERLAEAEHEGWMTQRRSNGWRLGEKDYVEHTHPCLIEYDKLADNDKAKDRAMVRSIPGRLRNNGFVIVRLFPQGPRQDDLEQPEPPVD
jgi:hypothetical protein